MNTDIRLSVNFWQNYKTKKLERRLGLAGVKSLQILWLWAAANRPSGVLSSMTGEDIECVAEWNGEFDLFVKTLVELRWIDVDANNNYILHDWAENNEWASQADTRADKARLSKLAQVNPDAYAKLKDEGVTAISRAEYDKLTAVKRINNNFTPEPGKTLELEAEGKNIAEPEIKGDLANATANAELRASSCSFPSPSPIPSFSYPSPNLTNSTPKALNIAGAQKNFCAGAEESAGKNKITLNKLLNLWNEILSPLNFPQALKATPLREKSFKARLNALKEREKVDWWKNILQKLAASSFMLESAKNKANWLTFDWLLNENNLVKICEGKYDDRKSSTKETPKNYDEALTRLGRKTPPTFDEAMARYGFNNNLVETEARHIA